MSGSYDESMTDVSSDSFWEVGNYKRSVKRVDDGNRLCNDLMSCLHERARIEKSYAQQLSEWGKRWRQLIEKGPLYGTLEQACAALCTEAEKVSELHMEMEITKKSYHSACKEEKLAASRENNGKLESSNTPEAQKKLQEKVEKCQQEAQKTKERYQKSLEELDKLTPQYMENMEQVFEQWQQFEDKRICFFRELLLEVKQHLDLSTNHRFQTIYHTLEDTVSATDVEDDLKWFRSNYGPGMPMNWPQFEDWSIDLNRTLSRREKKKPSEGVTLTGISQTGSDQPVQPAKTSSRRDKNSVSPRGEMCVWCCGNSTEDTTVEEEENEEEEEETAVEQHTTVNHISVNKEEIKTASSTEKTPDWSDEDTGANPFSTNGDGNPFEDEPAAPALSVAVKALYDYDGQEQDELTFKAGEELTKIGEEDDQGWCRGRLKDGKTGLYPANYVEDIQ
ncbi:Protein kinase C and casein kinase substrate in neurons protein 2 [Liparis tanakae]|uniref:Protein kinase C and casein kinase substrate in neurons protein 2 n=1 Tax=Liparis tanakae TaxID=230148 RepID=A0A4Z2HB79_9TELE|nr:Protein kinase C and casein kinase substrate in neurons protein 2 [Liparis tanakae]